MKSTVEYLKLSKKCLQGLKFFSTLVLFQFTHTIKFRLRFFLFFFTIFSFSQETTFFVSENTLIVGFEQVSLCEKKELDTIYVTNKTKLYISNSVQCSFFVTKENDIVLLKKDFESKKKVSKLNKVSKNEKNSISSKLEFKAIPFHSPLSLSEINDSTFAVINGNAKNKRTDLYSFFITKSYNKYSRLVRKTNIPSTFKYLTKSYFFRREFHCRPPPIFV